MAEWTKDQKNFWFRCKDTTETTTQDEDAWVDELYKNSSENHENDDMINDEEVVETNGQTKKTTQRIASSRYHPWVYRLGGLLWQYLDI